MREGRIMKHKISPVMLLLLWLLLPGSLSAQDLGAGDTYSDPLRSGGSGPPMVVIRDGKFSLGGGRGPKADQVEVTIDYLLGVGVTEITLGQYRNFLTASRSADLKKFTNGSDKLPVTGISWDEAEAYVTWLSRETGHYYRLPSASEWEYAARSGTSSTYSWGDDVGENRANCLNCKSPHTGKVAPVGSFSANDWGLYDMHGNVWEWTKDCIDPVMAPPINGMPKLFGNCDLRELRGGSTHSDAWSIRAGTRASAQRQGKTSDLGFRVVMDIPE